MKATMKLVLFLFCTGVFLASCKKDEKTPQEMIEGKWTIQSAELLGQTSSGDGSYLKFNACGQECTGVDYDASDGTSGTFTYTLNSDGTSLVINDTTNDGGNYNATWDVLELTETDLRIVGNTIFGSLKIEMTKD